MRLIPLNHVVVPGVTSGYWWYANLSRVQIFHCRVAKEVAEEYFDALRVLPQLIERRLIPAPAPTTNRALVVGEALNASNNFQDKTVS